MKLVKLRTLTTKNKTAKSRLSAVCAASGLVYYKNNWVVVADDENHIALFPKENGSKGVLKKILSDKLPTNSALRKKQKADLESLCITPLGLLIVPSGSKSNRVFGSLLTFKKSNAISSSKIDFSKLYSHLENFFTELNIEGAVILKDQLVLAQRGNGKSGRNALIILNLKKALRSLQKKSNLSAKTFKAILDVKLPKIKNISCGLTDLCVSEGRLFFSAAAEDGDDTYLDGTCTGSIIGEISSNGKLLWFKKVSSSIKFEGIWAKRVKDKLIFYLVNDDDNPKKPASLSSCSVPI